MRKLLVTVSLLLCFPLMAQVLQPLGSGLPARVVASFAAGDEYLALFEQKNPAGGDNIFTGARWNGTYWSYYSGGLNIPTDVKNVSGTYNYHSVALYHDQMYVGAYIANANGDAANSINHLYRWSGSIWETVPNSINSTRDGIVAMTVFNDKLVVAGRFQNSLNGGVMQNIATYDGTDWQYVGDNAKTQGTDGYINSLVSTEGRLYIGGKFRNFNGDYTGNLAFYTDANGGWGGIGSPFIGTNAEVMEIATFGSSLAVLGLNNAGAEEIRIFSNGSWSAPLSFDTFTKAEPTTIAGAGNNLLIGGKFEKDGNGTSLLRYENGVFSFTGTRINGDFSLGQRGNEAFVWGAFTEQNTGIRNISRIETTYGDIVGSLFFDKDQNCSFNGNDVGLAGILLRFERVETQKYAFATTDSLGRFAIALPEGNYTVQAFTGRHWVNNCASNYNVKVRKGLYSMVNLGQYISPGINDAEVHVQDVSPSVVRAGDEVHLQLTVKNLGSTTLNGPTVQFRHDPRLGVFKSDPAPDNYNAATHEATYTLLNIGMGETKVFDVMLTLPSNATSSDIYLNSANTGSLFTGNDVYTQDNFDTTDLTLAENEGSLVKTSDLGGTVNYKVMSLSYKVKFTNIKGSMVKRVVLLDTLDKNIVIKRVELTGLSPANGNVRLENGILVVEFPDANLTALESNPTNSSGFITYNVVLKQQLNHNDQVHNRATGDFDSRWKGSSNTVAVTMVNPNVGVTKISGSIHKVYPNPASQLLTLEFDKLQTGMLEVMDNLGKVVLTQSLKGKEATVDVSGLNPGIYIVRTADGTAMISVTR